MSLPAPLSGPKRAHGHIAATPSAISASCKTGKPPSLVIRNKAKWDTVSSLMSEHKLHFTSARSISEGIRVQTMSSSDHRGLTHLLRDCGIEYYTYALEDKRRLTVVIRGLPMEVTTDQILEDLKFQSLPVLSVHRMYQPTTRVPFNLVLVHLELSPKGKQIFNIKAICQLSGLRVEPPRARGVSKQYNLCQPRGHAQQFCHAHPQRVKCLEDHAAADSLDKTPVLENPPSCVLCGQKDHPTNYRECPKAPRRIQPVKNTCRHDRSPRAPQAHEKSTSLQKANDFQGPKAGVNAWVRPPRINPKPASVPMPPPPVRNSNDGIASPFVSATSVFSVIDVDELLELANGMKDTAKFSREYGSDPQALRSNQVSIRPYHVIINSSAWKN